MRTREDSDAPMSWHGTVADCGSGVAYGSTGVARRLSAALDGRYAGCMTSVGASGLPRFLASAETLTLDASPELSTATTFRPLAFACQHSFLSIWHSTRS